MKSISSILIIALLVLVLSIISFAWIGKKDTVDFTTQIKPIINKHCISCHGGVKQKGGFSFLFREEAMAVTESGQPAIIPGEPAKSELMRRITNKDPEERMPYKHDPLTKEEINLFSKWIKQGAKWGDHWAYTPVKNTPVPLPTTFFGLINKKSSWAKNEVDLFIEQKLNEQELAPSKQANKQTLLRRVSLDIIGMPAPENLAKKYLADNSESAYATLVDSLLALPKYGEKWTSFWLDLARYADTKGYERDVNRNIWRYRDWLIHAFNDDKPYDRFLTEQIAGDLLPNPTDDDYIASAFHRNTMTNDEGGTDNEEFRTSAVMDRVNTTWQATMGTTFACVQCHSHPYDPFKHDDYYKFMAFFNDTRDEDTEADYPLLRHYNDSMKLELDKVANWIQQNDNPAKAAEAYTFLKTWQPAINSLTADSFVNAELSDTKWLALRNNASCRLQNLELQNKNQLIYRYQSTISGGTWTIHLDNPKGKVIAIIPIVPLKNGWTIAASNLFVTAGRHNLYFSYSNPTITSPETNGVTFDWFYFTDKLSGVDKKGFAANKDAYWKLLTADVPTTPIMMENPASLHRTSYVFERGNWLVKGKKVTADVPHSLNPFPADAPKNRLGLASWLTSDQNPLTARTLVNHIWQQLFGTGLAETLEDMGSQGIAPTHPELLDWLSYRLMHTDKWSIKKLIKSIVLSATYQQDAAVTPAALQKDPYNKFYSRSSRVRLTAEQVRDQALCISGLMSSKMYGPSVYPYQPNGIWLSPWSGEKWVQSKGEDQYRRALYTYWKRSAAYPSMMAFDAVSREVCTVRRISTNTPLQALTTLNDSAFLDIARHFANRMKQQGGVAASNQIATGFKLATNHAIDEKSLQALLKLYNTAFSSFKSNGKKINKVMGINATAGGAETAALTVVANVLLNLDEVVTKN
ncbi:DUF1553 domain-containing protein [Ferruginibacter sp.]|uniref:DUF1553 domain-containing protein n=1 Tax=Ferruginibacter sp. TaxID=1940288 RepID=UPI0019BC9458|nr:DUF1553 domain-containing protein [Ferruginibacter sp.]MBC7629092.1 DUF1553 domain-containing protein [Ferruginibacter sp.]